MNFDQNILLGLLTTRHLPIQRLLLMLQKECLCAINVYAITAVQPSCHLL